MILFLDFDGVLHPQHDDQMVPAELAFCHLPRFETIMREFPEIEIVISSTWREQFDLANLRNRFAADIAERIIGTTPLHLQTELSPPLHRREQEIIEWLQVAGRAQEHWIALDDTIWQFSRYRSHVVECVRAVGLDDGEAARVRRACAADGARY
jgi:hypothetical protein